MAEDVLKKVKRLRETVDAMKTKQNQLEGRLGSLYDQLQNEFGLSSLDEAEAKLKDLDEQQQEQESRLRECISDLDDMYDELKDAGHR